jgi:hypothetical protein
MMSLASMIDQTRTTHVEVMSRICFIAWWIQSFFFRGFSVQVAMLAFTRKTVFNNHEFMVFPYKSYALDH